MGWAEYCPAPLRHRLQTDSYARLTDNILFAAFAVTEQSDQVSWVPVGRKMAASLPESSAA